MAAVLSPPHDTTTVRKDASTAIPPAPAPAIFRTEVRSNANMGVKINEKPPAVSHTSSSELGVPGSFPRDPRVALDHLSDQAVATGAPESTTDSSTIIDAVQEDFRHAVDAASQYLPESVVGAIDSVLPVGTTDTQDAAKKLDSGHVQREAQTTSKLNFKDIAVGGIASSDFTPSSSKSRIASGGASEASKGADGARSAKPSFLSFKDFAIAGIASDFYPSSSKSRFVSSSAVDDSLDTPAATPTPVPRSVSSPAATKEKRDNDAPHSGAAYVDAQRPAEGTTRDLDLRRKAIETVALGAGIGTLGSAAYQYSGAPEQPSASTSSEARGVLSRDASLASVMKEYPSFATYALLPAVTSDSPAKPTTSAIDSSSADDSSKAKKAAEGAAIGAGVGTVGGAAYAHSRPSQLPTPPSEESDDKATPARTSSGTGPSAATTVGSQPAFVSYAPGRVITEDTPLVDDESEKEPSSVPGTAETRDASSDQDWDLSSRKVAQAAALGIGAGAVGGAAGSAATHSREPQTQEPTKELDPSEQPAFVSYAPGPVITEDTQFEDDESDESDKDVPSTSAVRDEDTSGVELQSASKAAQDGATATEAKDATSDQFRKARQAAAVGVGAGAVGGAAYEPERKSANAPTASPSQQTQPSLATYAPASGQVSSDVSPTNAPEKKGLSASEEKEKDTKAKKGLEAATAGAGIGVIGGVAYQRIGTSPPQVPPRNTVEPHVHSGVVEPASTPSRGVPEADTKKTPEPLSKEAAAVTGTTVASDRNTEKEQQKREKEAEKEHQKRMKEAEKCEKEEKKHEKEIAAAATAADKRAAKEKRHGKELEKEEKRREKERKEAEKEQAKREQEAADREENTKKREAELATAAIAGAGAGVGAGVAGDKLTKGKNELEKADSRQGDKQAKDESVQPRTSSAQQQGSDTKALSPEHPSILTASGARKHEREVAAGTAAVGAGTGVAGDKLTKRQAFDEAKKVDPDQEAAKETLPVHPSVKAASVRPERRPGPTALGAAGPNDRPRSGADSDFPLPSVNASREHVARAVSINGTGVDGGTASRTSPSTAPGLLEPSTSPVQRTRSERSRYYGTEGLQEKQQGGALGSSFIERKKVEEKATHEHGNGNGKKEGFVRHLVGKMKDKLHHQEKDRR